MATAPRDRLPDSTVAFARDGYRFIAKRCDRYGSDVFETRLLLRTVTCMRGAESARLFYSDRFQRLGAMPAAMRKTLFGEGGVQGLDGDAHHQRKQRFMSLMTPEAIDDLAERFAARWRAAMDGWQRRDEVVLHDETARVLCAAVCDWAGVPIAPGEVARRTGDLTDLFDPLASLPPYWRARRARERTDAWIADLVERTRDGDLRPPDGSTLEVIATHRDPFGSRLPARVAAVEVINLLRPTVAIVHFIVFAALALQQHPDWQERLRRGGDDEVEWFVQEVRRYYPFFLAAAARVRQGFEWNGASFPRGRLVLLDVYGTNRHPRIWQEPDRFDPTRFRDWTPDPHSFIPQGGGDHHAGHRCAGEWITIRLMEVAVALLTREMDYDVPYQDLHVSLSRMPARPRSGFVMRGVRGSGG